MIRSLLRRAHMRARDYKPYILAGELLRSMQQIDRIDRRVKTLHPPGPARGAVLFSYINDPFYLKPGKPLPHSHTHFWESYQMVQTWLDLGYSVDVIHWQNNRFLPQKPYTAFVDVRLNMERLASLLNQDCLKILHLETAHWLFHTSQQYRRLLAVQRRKGATIAPFKHVEANWSIETADCAVTVGNDFTESTYRYAGTPIYRVPISAPFTYPWPEQKDFDACRRRFLWFGSGGLVHKGLDLALDAFAALPDFHLTVCGPVQRERDFVRVYERELYHTPNIQTVGWVDVSGSQFTDIADRCLGLVYPSCSEGGGGGVISCMHAGLIPLVSRESSVVINPGYGVVLEESSLEEIRAAVQQVAALPAVELQQMARKAWEYARAQHTREVFAAEYRRVIETILADFANQGVRRQPVLAGPQGADSQ